MQLAERIMDQSNRQATSQERNSGTSFRRNCHVIVSSGFAIGLSCSCGTLGDLARAPQKVAAGWIVLVTHQPWRRKERWAFVQPGFTVQVFPSGLLVKLYPFPNSNEEKEMFTVEKIWQYT